MEGRQDRSSQDAINSDANWPVAATPRAGRIFQTMNTLVNHLWVLHGDKRMNKARLVPAIALLAIFAGPVTANNKAIAWLDGKVVALGHVSNNNGQEIPTATIVLYDPGNANPLAQQQVWVVTSDAYLARKTRVDLTVGTSFKAYRSGETSSIYGFLIVRYVDDKGREKSELHPILNALSVNDIPSVTSPGVARAQETHTSAPPAATETVGDQQKADPVRTLFKDHSYIGMSAVDFFGGQSSLDGLRAAFASGAALDACIARAKGQRLGNIDFAEPCKELVKQTNALITNILNGNTATFPSPSSTPTMDISYKFSSAKLQEIDIFFTPNADAPTTVGEQVTNLTGKYGKPTKVRDIPLQNGFGAQFVQHTTQWDMPDGTRVLCFNDPTNRPHGFDSVLVSFASISAENGAAKVAAKANNPY